MVPKPKKIDQQLVVVELSLVLKKVQVEQELEQQEALFWRTGGVTFAAKPKTYNKKINKKMYRGALNCIFNELLKRKRLHLTDKLTFSDKKTKLGQELLNDLKIVNALFITSIDNPNAFFSLRNIKNITVIDYKEINPYILMKHDNVVIDSNVLEQIKQATIL